LSFSFNIIVHFSIFTNKIIIIYNIANIPASNQNQQLTLTASNKFFTLPAGSKILSFRFEKTIILAGNSISQVAAIVGNASDDNQYLESVNLAVAVGVAAQATVDAGMQVDDCDNIGTSDVLLQATFTATTGDATSGQIVVTVSYVQRQPDGSVNPTEYQN
jgi:hypothetical protein